MPTKKTAAERVNPEMGGRIAQARRKEGYTQRQMAEMFGISEVAWRNYEKGRELKSGMIVEICAILKCSPNWLLGVSEEGACLHEDSLLLRQLRMVFDELNAEGQKKVVDYARDLSSIPSYTETGEKEPSSSTNVS
jgi:transcriptional regulator with XRE-family HTH domain